MDETAKTEARNYLSAAGFFILAACCLIAPFMDPGTGTTFDIVVGFGLFLTAALLIVLRKRDMIAMLFMMLGFLYTCFGFLGTFPGVPLYLCFAGLIFLMCLITLTGKDKVKWLIMLIPLILAIGSFLNIFLPEASMVFLWLHIIVAFYFAFACVCERCSLPGRKLLTADEEVDFKASGSVLGYLFFAATSGMYVVHYIAGESMIQIAHLHTINIVAAILMVFAAVLLFAVGKMRFTPVMFLLMGVSELLALFSQGTVFIGCGILFIIIGLFAMLRKESRILPGIMLIVYGCSAFVSAYTGGNMPVVSVILNAVPCLIAIYLAFVVYSQKKLPKF